MCQATIEVAGVAMKFDFPTNAPLPSPGERIKLSFDPGEAIRVFSAA
jgi:hypothetical protein